MNGHAWKYSTRRGDFFIVENGQGRFVIIYDDENLGSYHHPDAAADDLAGGHTFTPSNGVDSADLDIPDSISEWERVR